ncbi:hypothetical protein DSL64_15890 [Dyadobacter luteus]|uniref:Uncharacterized protein n=1 Tax=Dyadobacter luteus TaxID=2259619 RepID=A0A3D8Y9K9_9BACT|nr:hypothetical protein [Dyadobacter luteus]REA60153.1 hypothetical protein DSL64_15890 [Dyadobacter luteus]
MKDSPRSLRIPFEHTSMIVTRLSLQGTVSFTVKFEDGRTPISIIRKKDFAGYYWVSDLHSSTKLVDKVGRRIMEYTKLLYR